MDRTLFAYPTWGVLGSKGIPRNLLISPFNLGSRSGQVPGTSGVSKRQSGVLRSLAPNDRSALILPR